MSNEKEKLFTRGNREGTKVTYNEMIKVVADYIRKNPEANYEITIGTDSQNHKKTRMVEVITVRRIGDGGIFFFYREDIMKIQNIREKIHVETSRSIANATGFVDALQEELLDDDIDLDEMFYEDRLAFAVHADIGKRGKTQEYIREICTWIEASGFDYCIKPDSYAASGVANMLSK